MSLLVSLLVSLSVSLFVSLSVVSVTSGRFSSGDREASSGVISVSLFAVSASGSMIAASS
jgi:hypothetical protein